MRYEIAKKIKIEENRIEDSTRKNKENIKLKKKQRI